MHDINKFVEKYEVMVYRIANKILNDQDLAHDISQEVFIKVWGDRDILECEDSKKVKAWLRKVTKNHAIDIYRKNKRMREILREIRKPDQCFDPAQLEASELFDIIKQEIASISDPIKRKALYLVFVCDYEPKEAAAKLGVSPGKVRNWCHRFRKRLRAIPEIERLDPKTCPQSLGGDKEI